MQAWQPLPSKGRDSTRSCGLCSLQSSRKSSEIRGGIQLAAEARDRSRRRRALEEFGDRAGELGIGHRGRRRPQRTDAEAAQDLLVVVVLLPGDELSDACEQGG